MSSGHMIGSLGLAAGLTYLFDPEMGRRRRALIWDQAVHAAHNLRAVTLTKASGVRQRRLQGPSKKPDHSHHHEILSDQALAARVHSRLGRLVTYPSAIEVRVQGNQVTLSGPISKRDARRVLAGVRRISGVTEYVDHLERHADKEQLLADPAAARRRHNWSTATRLLALLGGGAAIAGTALLARNRIH